MKKRAIGLFLIGFLLFVGAWGCSGGADRNVAERKEEMQPNATAEAIRDHAQAPIKRARTAANMGDDRLEAIDRAIQNSN